MQRSTITVPSKFHMSDSETSVQLALPSLPPATADPWSAEIVEAHQGLELAFQASQKALNLDESDPIRLGHHLKQAEVFMASIVDVLGSQTANPLPTEYIDEIGEAVSSLTKELWTACTQAKTALVIVYFLCESELIS